MDIKKLQKTLQQRLIDERPGMFSHSIDLEIKIGKYNTEYQIFAWWTINNFIETNNSRCFRVETKKNLKHLLELFDAKLLEINNKIELTESADDSKN